MLTKMCLNMGFALVAYLHTESQNSNNMFDGEFAVTKRLITRFVQETTFYVVAPVDIVEVLTYDNGINTRPLISCV